MRLLLLTLTAALLAPSPVTAQDESVIAVELSSFRYAPATITLEHGRRYALRLHNDASGGHDFVAKAFFGAASIDARDRGRVDNGGVDVRGGETVQLRLTAPAAGRYPVHCSHFMHAVFGMKGEIVVR